jgi:hypothetical protein
MTRKGGALYPERDAMMLRLKREGKTLDEIATFIGISRQRVQQVLQRMKQFYPRWTETTDDNLYNFIVEYKLTHDGNTPTMKMMLTVPKLITYDRLVFALKRLQDQGRIALDVLQSGSRGLYRITIVGATWTPPENYETPE